MEIDNFIDNNFINNEIMNIKYVFKLNIEKGLMDNIEIILYTCGVS